MTRRVLLLVLVLLAGCAPGGRVSPTRSPAVVALPPVAAPADYQLGGAYPPPDGVRVVARDRREKPLAEAYNICYLNVFQGQPEEIGWWLSEHPDLVVRTSSGAPLMDRAWGEPVLDVSTAQQRRALLQLQKPWIDGCADAGFQAVEADNQDSYARSGGAFGFDANREYMKVFTAYAHRRGLAVAQKNAGVEYGATGREEVGLDFAVAEECSRWDECRTYTDVYGGLVLQIEYADQPEQVFRKACREWSGRHSVVRRDRDLVAPGQPGYFYASC